MTPPLFDDDEIKQRVSSIWEKIFSASNVVIKHAQQYGYSGMGVLPDPNIHQMLLKIRILDQIIDVLLGEEMEYDERRLMLNAKQQLLRMEMVAAALQADDRVRFDRVMEELERQAPF